MYRTASYSALLLAALCFSGCASDAAEKAPSAKVATTIDGHWQLDLQASDDVRARLQPLFERNENKWRRTAERYEEMPPRSDGNGPDGTDEGISDVRWLQRERQKEVQSLIALLSPATELDIKSGERSIRIGSNKAEGARVVTPGESSSLFLPIGAFAVSSAWEKGSLLIESRGTSGNKMRIVERFTPRGEQLEKRMEVKLPNIGKQSFRVVYKR